MDKENKEFYIFSIVLVVLYIIYYITFFSANLIIPSDLEKLKYFKYDYNQKFTVFFLIIFSLILGVFSLIFYENIISNSDMDLRFALLLIVTYFFLVSKMDGIMYDDTKEINKSKVRTFINSFSLFSASLYFVLFTLAFDIFGDKQFIPFLKNILRSKK